MSFSFCLQSSPPQRAPNWENALARAPRRTFLLVRYDSRTQLANHAIFGRTLGEQKDFEVYSCHVSPDGKRLATAGGDGHVRIWSTESIYSADDPDYQKPRQLCHMSHHLGTIHSVRFSPNGRYLASGADDKIICVYYLDKGPPTTTFGTPKPPAKPAALAHLPRCVFLTS